MCQMGLGGRGYADEMTGDWPGVPTALLLALLAQTCITCCWAAHPLRHNWPMFTRDRFNITVQPREIRLLHVSMERYVIINCTCGTVDVSEVARAQVGGTGVVPEWYPTSNDTVYLATIRSRDSRVAIPIGEHYGSDENRTADELVLRLDVGQVNVFRVRALHVGRVVMVIHVASEGTGLATPEDLPQTLSILEYRVAVVRPVRTADLVFETVVASIALLNSFSIGCVADWPSLRKHFRHPTALIISICCQFIIMPALGLAIAKLADMNPELSLGLFCAACVPGGGSGHVMVSVVDADRALSVSINFMTTFITLVSLPLWIFSMGRFLGSKDPVFPLLAFEVWLAAAAGAYLLGIWLRMCSVKTADAILNWLVKPALLLFVLLFITLGSYINIYLFNTLDHSTMLCVMLLPVLGYMIGGIVAFLARQESDYVKTIATETTVTNCLLVLVMLRFSLPQPDADVASAVPMWVVLTSPVPFVLASVLQKIRSCMKDRCAKRREKKYRHFSIVSSLLNVTNVTNLSASMSPKVSSPVNDQSDDQSDVLIHVDEKVTVV